MTISEHGLDLVGLLEKHSDYKAYIEALERQVADLEAKILAATSSAEDLAEQIFEHCKANGLAQTPLLISPTTVATVTKCLVNNEVEILFAPFVDLRQLEVAV